MIPILKKFHCLRTHVSVYLFTGAYYIPEEPFWRVRNFGSSKEGISGEPRYYFLYLPVNIQSSQVLPVRIVIGI